MVKLPHLISQFDDHVPYELRCPVYKKEIKI